MSTRDPIVITGIGMRCSVGQNAVQSCASIRAGISHFAEWTPVGSELGGVAVAPVKPDLGDRDWMDKLDDLATQPLLESLWAAKLEHMIDEAPAARCGLFLATPPTDRPGVDSESAARFEDEVRERTLFPLEPADLRVVSRGRAGFLIALESARRSLLDGTFDVCVVGGIDSLLEAQLIDSLSAESRLKTPDVPAGLTPGEAAAFVVIEPADHARRRGVPARALTVPVRIAMESDSPAGLQPVRGKATARVLRESLADAPCGPDRIGRALTDLNGERWLFLEWGLAVAQALSELPPDWRPWYPADCLGDVGAATGAVHVCVAVRGLERGYAGGEAILICNRSESGERAATSVSAVQAARA